MKLKIIILAVIALAVSQYGFAAEEATEAVADQAMEMVVVANKICPISGEKIGEMGEGKVVEYNGKQYKLCCAACEKDFLKDPDAAVKKIEDSMAAETKSGALRVAFFLFIRQFCIFP